MIRELQPGRAAALARLEAFAPRAGAAYARGRNTDPGPGAQGAVSGLSPWIRHRLVSEREVIERVLEHHALGSASKFVDEVFWRTYFKGWLEQHPSVWAAYRRDVERLLVEDRRDVADAIAGRTPIECFNAWARELVETGTLHNHARMWFASIWIFTLELPWQLGADFFLRHLADGDPASNTCSWRWVAGLHTRGKTYLARAENIARHTNGRFDPRGQLAPEAPALVEDERHPRVALPEIAPAPDEPFRLLLTEEDLAGDRPACLFERASEIAVLSVSQARSPAPLGDVAERFARGACASLGVEVLGPSDLAAFADRGDEPLVAPYVPTGPVRDVLDASGPAVRFVLRDHDRTAWPHAGSGFFALRKRIPQLVRKATRRTRSD